MTAYTKGSDEPAELIPPGTFPDVPSTSMQGGALRPGTRCGILQCNQRVQTWMDVIEPPQQLGEVTVGLSPAVKALIRAAREYVQVCSMHDTQSQSAWLKLAHAVLDCKDVQV
jgi:hypothetical protein